MQQDNSPTTPLGKSDAMARLYLDTDNLSRFQEFASDFSAGLVVMRPARVNEQGIFIPAESVELTRLSEVLALRDFLNTYLPREEFPNEQK